MMVGVDGEGQKRRRGLEVAGKVKERVGVVEGAGGEGKEGMGRRKYVRAEWRRR